MASIFSFFLPPPPPPAISGMATCRADSQGRIGRYIIHKKEQTANPPPTYPRLAVPRLGSRNLASVAQEGSRKSPDQ